MKKKKLELHNIKNYSKKHACGDIHSFKVSSKYGNLTIYALAIYSELETDNTK